MKKQQWLDNQLQQAKYDANEHVDKGSDLGVIGYTRVYLYVGGGTMLFMYVVSKLGSHVDTADPIMGPLFFGVVFYAFWQLLKHFNGGKR